MRSLGFQKFKKIHMIGIGGSGMIGVAMILQKRGFNVTGSDLLLTPELKELKKLGSKVQLGHEPRLIKNADLVVASSAISKKNPELVFAQKSDITIIPRAEMLGTLMKPYRSIAVAGSHGKTSTTSISASIFNAAGLSPTYVIGGQVLSIGRSSNLGEGNHIIVEADESDGSFLHLQPEVAIITNIDNDHLNFYDFSQAKLNQSFVSFAENLPFYGHLILNLDDMNIRKIEKNIHRKKISFGFTDINQYQIINVELMQGMQKFQLFDHLSRKLYKFTTSLSGKHNLYNLAAAICLALEEGISISNIKKGLREFKGVGRRFEISEVTVANTSKILVDDYGHHPAEILATFLAVKEKFPKKRICMIFEPHRFSRTQQLFHDFVKVLSKIDQLLLLDIYPASEAPIQGVSSKKLIVGVNQSGGNGVYIPTHLVQKWIAKHAQEFDILITQGAGNISQLNNSIQKKWALKK
ncbi:MAG: UDP-N-acetylmuramate--alanine ligase [SAR86 cluster bacterium BACL1 MAG-120920-bin57]|jgi:UDP-N-acetylmuramate--alanine ligase|uniref:UDP-N-acetylmuramate--L-alanine ligase n=2 Tax=SAR86 cluster TaxID=62672 RepID=A0A0R2UAB7_9GAMM|nr:MAG: UDP-N-acetylmuramate--alanine ligase [SAR86 cluster bacterium BACL1 MAG-120507-bin14]KRO41291.1 MAG: UDP-N-acetylmuramate--alanine ligase [SAR86 cluster bacterium BACL1 MAG-120920-bin57]KRO96465.1 MAG: UDP-N-acetylmuramate--alanine ligase [SAR86 cluster bacterium BACL1 MAG-120820-bin45]KRO96768.1 MAG: UDP-N-acetylmuramate--alanine ligase [SAR86 cluster bacterium BACL1 MAG-120828-bin5]KRO99152.1 MAG: UDP-N-acetylmuramate--alanine ligase [SAR86 cluster bacterium BACL1 MAG-120823-bin87]KR